MKRTFNFKFYRISFSVLALLMMSFTLVKANSPMFGGFDFLKIEPSVIEFQLGRISSDVSLSNLEMMPQPPSGAPTQIKFTILATSCGGTATLQLYLNGTALGSVNSDSSCSCSAPTKDFVVNDAALLASAWSSSNPNSIRIVSTNSYFAWTRATLSFSNGYSLQTPVYDFDGGNTLEPNLCNANYRYGGFDNTSQLDLTDQDDDGVASSMDCNDADASAGVGTPGVNRTFYRDADGDGLGNPSVSVQACSAPTGYVDNSSDCNDNGTNDIPIKAGYESKVVAQGGSFAGKHMAGVTTDPTSGNIYVATDGLNISVGSCCQSANQFDLWRVTPSGVVSFIGNYSISHFELEQLTWGPDGHIYTANQSGVFYKIDPTTGTSTVFSNSGIGLGRYGLDFASNGDLIVMPEGSAFYKILPGSGRTFLGSTNGGHGDSFGIQPDGNFVVFPDGGDRLSRTKTANHTDGTAYPSESMSSSTITSLPGIFVGYSNGAIDPVSGDVYATTGYFGAGSNSVSFTPGNGTASSTSSIFIGGSGCQSLRITNLEFGKRTDGKAGNSLFFLDNTTKSVYEVRLIANATPVAQNDNAEVNEDSSPNAVSVLSNDSDADAGDTLKITSVTQGTNGVVAITGNGTGLTYKPNANYNGADSFTYTIDDGHGETATATASVTVKSINDVPSFTKGANPTVNEDAGAQSITGWATAISKGPANESEQAVSFLVSNDNSGLFSAQPTVDSTGKLTFTSAPNANGSATVTARIKDDGGTANGGVDTSAPQTFTINVTPVNDAPTANSGSIRTDEDTDSAPFALSGSDIDGDSLTYDLVSQPTKGTFNKTTGIYKPNANANGSDSFTFVAKDADLQSAPATVNITINPVNDNPTITALTGPVDPVAVNTATQVSVGYSDVDTTDTHTVTFSWNDGTPNTVVNNVAGAISATAPHTYAKAGVYRVGITVQDNGGLTASTQFEYVVVYDPSAGFVTGGGFIMSPAGAYPANPSLAGKANFGFVSKYQKGSTVPTGNTEFQFHAGSFQFKSDSYEWLVISGAKAQYKGTGSVNGVPGYSFMLTATDGQVNGGGGVDKFRIKITKDDVVVYDNVGGSDKLDEANPQAIGGGSIVIHSK